jgi:hypothetical protein
MGKSSRSKGRHKLFNRAYDKASLIQPGAKSTLTDKEDAELRRYLYRKPVVAVPCQICTRPTQDRDRTHQGVPRGVRVCGPCLYNKPPDWGKEKTPDAVL